GGIPLLVGVVGSDRAAQDFKGLLRSAGIRSNHLITDPKRRTVLKERIVSEKFAAAVRKAAAATGKVWSVDPNAKSPPSYYRGAYVLTPNTREAERLS